MTNRTNIFNDTSRPACGATLVASNWAITAAHCVTDFFTGAGYMPVPWSKDSMSLVLGEFNISSSSDIYDGKR